MKRGMVIGVVLVAVCIVAVLLAMRFLRRPVAETPVTPPPVASSSSSPASSVPVSSIAASGAAAAEEQREGTPPKSAGTIPGFCCIRAAGTCVQSVGAATCLHEDRGLVFDAREEKCNEICMFLLLR